MNLEQLTYRNDLAVELITTLAQQNAVYTPASLVKHAFELADQACARIKADYDKAIEELNDKAAKTSAARQAEFDAFLDGIAACGSTSTNTQAAQGEGRVERRKADCNCSNLRRSTDKVEVRELSPEQALDMIASLIFPPKH